MKNFHSQFSLSSKWPFSVDRAPFFYGWVICFVSTLGIIMSIPGQTMGMAVFTDHFIEAFGLSRTQLSLAYLLGTLGSSVFLTRAGRFYDQAGARITILGASLGLGICLLFITSVDVLAGFIAEPLGLSLATLSFPLILLGYFGVRFTGQGVLTNASRNVLLVWFEKRRGLVSGARAVFVTLGFSLAPVALAFLIAEFGWRGALILLAIMVGVGFSLVALIFIRNTPDSCGLLPDGQKQQKDSAPRQSIPDKTISQARNSKVFWIYSLALSLHSLFITAMIFHIVSIFAEAGRTSADAFGYFFPQAMVSVSINLLASWASDRCTLKPLLVMKLGSFILAAWALLNLHHDWGYYLLILAMGTCSGLWGVLSNLAFIRFFGRLYLGEISGLNMTFMVIGSAIGPAMFSIGNDIFGSYHAGIWITLTLVAGLFVAAIFIRQNEPRST